MHDGMSFVKKSDNYTAISIKVCMRSTPITDKKWSSSRNGLNC